MPDTGTLSDLLAAQTERKLNKMRDGIVTEIERLRLELRFVEDAIGKKRRGKSEAARAVLPGMAPSPRDRTGQFDGLPRAELLAYVTEMGRPVKAPDVRRHLAEKGINRNLEAVRVALNRLQRSGVLIRDADGRYVVPSKNGTRHDSKPEAQLPAGTLGFDS